MVNLIKACVLLTGALIAFASAQPAHALRVVKEQVILDKLEDYKLCQSKDYSGDWCHDALKRWVDEHPDDSFQAGKLTRSSMNAWGAIYFFDKAFKVKKGDCKDEDVRLAVASALDLPKANQPEIVQQAQEIGLKTCLKEMKDKVFAEASVGSNRLQNICAVSTAAASLPALKQAKCKDLK